MEYYRGDEGHERHQWWRKDDASTISLTFHVSSFVRMWWHLPKYERFLRLQKFCL
jgi:hypothetical protein